MILQLKLVVQSFLLDIMIHLMRNGRRRSKKKKIKREFGQIKSRNPDPKIDKQLYTIKNV